MGGPRIRRATPLVLLCAALLVVGAAQAKPGSPDRSFGSDGKVVTDLGRQRGGVEAIALDPKGRIVAIGDLAAAGLTVTRYGADGRLDTTFSGDGVATPVSGLEAVGPPGGGARMSLNGEDVAVDGKGRVVVVGSVTWPESPMDESLSFALRLRRDGTPDSAFARGGLRITRFGVHSGSTAVAVDRGNRIVAVGWSAVITDHYDAGYSVIRYLPDGSLDRSFSGDGMRRGHFGRLAGGEARAVELDRRGRILVGGTAVDGAPDPNLPNLRITRFALIRLTDRGRLDRAFSHDGRVRTAFGSRQSRLWDIAIGRYGGIVAAGRDGPPTEGSKVRGVVARYRPNGRIDRAFSRNGRAPLSPTLYPSSVALDRSGRVVLGGSGKRSRPVVRLRSNGRRDRSFDRGAAARPRILTAVSDLTIDRHGRIVAGAGVCCSSGPFVLFRLNSR